MGRDLGPEVGVRSHELADFGKKKCQIGAAGVAIGHHFVGQPLQAEIHILAPALGGRIQQAEDRQPPVMGERGKAGQGACHIHISWNMEISDRCQMAACRAFVCYCPPGAVKRRPSWPLPYQAVTASKL